MGTPKVRSLTPDGMRRLDAELEQIEQRLHEHRSSESNRQRKAALFGVSAVGNLWTEKARRSLKSLVADPSDDWITVGRDIDAATRRYEKKLQAKVDVPAVSHVVSRADTAVRSALIAQIEMQESARPGTRVVIVEGYPGKKTAIPNLPMGRTYRIVKGDGVGVRLVADPPSGDQAGTDDVDVIHIAWADDAEARPPAIEPDPGIGSDGMDSQVGEPSERQ